MQDIYTDNSIVYDVSAEDQTKILEQMSKEFSIYYSETPLTLTIDVGGGKPSIVYSKQSLWSCHPPMANIKSIVEWHGGALALNFKDGDMDLMCREIHQKYVSEIPVQRECDDY